MSENAVFCLLYDEICVTNLKVIISKKLLVSLKTTRIPKPVLHRADGNYKNLVKEKRK